MTAPSLFIADESGFSTGFFGNGFGKCRAALCPLIVVSLFHFCRLADGLPFHFWANSPSRRTAAPAQV